MKKILALVMALAMVLTCVALAEENAAVYAVGSPLPDFTFTDINGVTHTLSETLKEKEMVLINLWATWCGPCKAEFPYLEEAYEQFSDKVEVFALSVEGTDDDEKLTAYAQEHGLTFPISRDEAGIAAGFGLSSVPTSLVVDRFGNVTFLESGSQTTVGAFTRLFGAFVGDDYTETNVITEIPGEKPMVDPISEAELSAALTVDGAETPLNVYNDIDKTTWPMISAEVDGRKVLKASNTGVDSSYAAVLVKVDAKAGDVVAFDYKVSSEKLFDMLAFSVNGTQVKMFSGEKGWATYGYAFPADGAYELKFIYRKDSRNSVGEDCAWIDNVRVVSGEEAAAVLAGNPVYPATTEETTMTLTNAKEIVFDDPTNIMEQALHVSHFYVANGTDSVNAKITLANGVDPETLLFITDADAAKMYMLTDGMGEDGYYFSNVPIASAEEATFGYSAYYVTNTSEQRYEASLICFLDEQHVNAFVKLINSDGITYINGWKYADGSLPSTDEAAELGVIPGMAEYTIKCVDQNGDPVTGVMINVCTDETCTPSMVDENGVLSFTKEAYPYVLHVLLVPEGYEFDTTVEEIAPEEGGEVTFTFHKM